MTYQTPSTPSTGAAISGSSLFSLGAELLGEVQRIVGQSKVRAIRLNLGGRMLKEFPISSASAAITVLLAVAAVVISNLRVEVVNDPT